MIGVEHGHHRNLLQHDVRKCNFYLIYVGSSNLEYSILDTMKKGESANNATPHSQICQL